MGPSYVLRGEVHKKDPYSIGVSVHKKDPYSIGIFVHKTHNSKGIQSIKKETPIV